jgi:hypothetical protein
MPYNWLRGSVKSRAALGRIRKTTTPLQNRGPMYSEEVKGEDKISEVN